MAFSGVRAQLPTSCHSAKPDTTAIPGRLRTPVRLLCQRCLAGTQLRRRAANGAKCRMFFKNFKNPLQGDSESAGALKNPVTSIVYL